MKLILFILIAIVLHALIGLYVDKLKLLEKRNKLKQEFASEDNILKRIERIIE